MTDAELDALNTWARKAATCVYLATEESVAADISAGITKLADAIAALREQVAALQKGDDMYYIRKLREAEADNAALREQVAALEKELEDERATIVYIER